VGAACTGAGLAGEMRLEPLAPDAERPLSLAFLLLVASLNMVEAFNTNMIWPMLPFLVSDLAGVPDADLGWRVGLVASAFFVAQATTSYCWGAAGDRFGRRPVLLLGMLGSAVSILLLGSAGTYAQAVAGRFAGGMLNGNAPIVKAYIGEVSAPDHLAKNFGVFALSYGLCSSVAPLVGGGLMRPADRWPAAFRGTVFDARPYLLPCAVTSALSLAAVLTAYWFVPETAAFARRKQRGAEGAAERRSAAVELVPLFAGGEGEGGDEAGPPSWTKVTVLMGCLNVYMSGLLTLVEELFPVFAKLDRGVGGLGISSATIGTLLSLSGLLLVAHQLTTTPYLVGRFGPSRVLKASSLLAVPAVMLYPLAGNPAVRSTPAFLPLLLAAMSLKNCVAGSFVTTTLQLVNNSCRTEVKARVLSTVQAATALLRCLMPLATGALLKLGFELGAPIAVTFGVAGAVVLGYGLLSQRVPRALDKPS